jgi:hypothetical protein
VTPEAERLGWSGVRASADELFCLRRYFLETELLVVQRDQRVHLRGFSSWKQTCCEPDRENESCNGGERPGVSR